MTFGGHDRVIERVAPVAAVDETQVKADAAKAALEEEKNKKGQLSTILTSGQGVAGSAPVNKKTLLGQ